MGILLWRLVQFGNKKGENFVSQRLVKFINKREASHLVQGKNTKREMSNLITKMEHLFSPRKSPF